MISIKTLQGNVANMSRSAWLVSLGAFATVSQESRQIVEKVSQWNAKQSVADVRTKSLERLTTIKESMGNLFNNMSMPKLATT